MEYGLQKIRPLALQLQAFCMLKSMVTEVIRTAGANHEDDAHIVVDTTGKFYYSCMSYNNPSLNPSDIVVASSTDSGQSWTTNTANPIAHSTNGDDNDKPWIATDQSNN